MTRMLAQVSSFGLDFEDEPEYGSVVVTRYGPYGQWIDGWRRELDGWWPTDPDRMRAHTWAEVTANKAGQPVILEAIFRPGRREG